MKNFRITMAVYLSVAWLLAFASASYAQEMAVGDEIRERIER